MRILVIFLIYLITIVLDVFLMYHLYKENINRYYKLIYNRQISTIGDLFNAMDMYLDKPTDDSIYDFSCCFIPIINILTLCILIVEFIWDKIKNIKLK